MDSHQSSQTNLYIVSGHPETGEKIASTLGVPTINLWTIVIDNEYTFTPGVFVGMFRVNEKEVYAACIYIHEETIRSGQPGHKIECHALGNLTLTVQPSDIIECKLLKCVRDPISFEGFSWEDIQKQLYNDVKECTDYFYTC